MELFTATELSIIDRRHAEPISERLTALTAKNCIGGGLSEEESAEYESLWASRQAYIEQKFPLA